MPTGNEDWQEYEELTAREERDRERREREARFYEYQPGVDDNTEVT